MRSTGIGLASFFWSAVNAGIRWAVQLNFLKPVRLPVRVISVGNLQVGGSGKTPLVAQIAQEAIQRGMGVCILTRGYRGKWESFRGEGGVICPGDPVVSSVLTGDEPALLHDLCPEAYLGVGLNRVRQFFQVLQKCSSQIDLVILDDGFQHWKIHKDVEVVALTSAQPTSFLFRDWARAVRQAHLLVWTKGEQRPPSFGKPMAKVRLTLPFAQVGQRIWLVTAVADNRAVCEQVLSLGYAVVCHIQKKDHDIYSLGEVQEILKQAHEARAQVVITGKDWVKWRDLGILPSQVLVLEPHLVFEEGREAWLQILWEP